MFLDYFALGVLIAVALILFYGIIAIHDIPYEVAVHRHHPHQDAIHVAGWVSLFTLHVSLAVSLDLGDALSAGSRLGLYREKRGHRPSGDRARAA